MSHYVFSKNYSLEDQAQSSCTANTPFSCEPIIGKLLKIITQTQHFFAKVKLSYFRYLDRSRSFDKFT